MGGHAATARGKEHQVAGAQFFLGRDGLSLAALGARGAGQVQAGDFAEDIQNQAAAIEAFGVVAAPAIGGADGIQACLDDAVAQGGHGGFLRQAQATEGGAGLFGGQGRLGGAGNPGQRQGQEGR
ncbi:hypothetical protein D3C72_1190520 [compost metagenome]